MTRPLVINPLAEADLAEAKTWYDLRQPGLGDAFLARVEVVFLTISQFPQMYALEYADLRVGPVKRYPYLVVYRIDDDQITVVAVYPSRCDPQGWQARA